MIDPRINSGECTRMWTSANLKDNSHCLFLCRKLWATLLLLGIPSWQMGPYCFKLSTLKIQTLRVNLHFKTGVFEGNYAIYEKPVWSSGFSVLSLAGQEPVLMIKPALETCISYHRKTKHV